MNLSSLYDKRKEDKMTALTQRELSDIADQTLVLARHGGKTAQIKIVYAWVKNGAITQRQHELLCRFVYEDQSSIPEQPATPPIPHRIVVKREGEEVFRTERGDRPEDYPLRDYTCFGSPIIGAAYSYLSWEDIAKRIREKGYETTFHYETTVY
jgi:hypothetical protein